MSATLSEMSKLLESLTEVRDLPTITLESIAERLKGEALIVLCLVSILPFLQPIPIPGLSSVLGSVVLLQGIGMIFWSRPFLTEKMKKKVIPRERFEQIYVLAKKFGHFTSKLSFFKHPMTNSRVSHVICGLSIILSAAFLSLPLPIPFSNFVPALSIALICVGLLEEDVMLILFGHSITVAVIWMGVFSYHLIREQIQNWF